MCTLKSVITKTSTNNLRSEQVMSRVDNFFFFVIFSFFVLVIMICNIVPHADILGFAGKNGFSGHEEGNEDNIMLAEKVHLDSRKSLLYGVCTNRDISISQSRYSTTGIPGYIVQIVNTCVSGCAPSDIHLHCGWFASARIVNPRTFKRLSYDDCLVNGGKPLRIGQAKSSYVFPYMNGRPHDTSKCTMNLVFASKNPTELERKAKRLKGPYISQDYRKNEEKKASTAQGN